MRAASNRILTEVVASLQRQGPGGVVFVDPDDYAGLVQRLAGVNGLGLEATNQMLALGGVALGAYGLVRRYEWVEA